jgi:hypothetical protein
MSESTKSPAVLRWGVVLAAGLMALGLASGPAMADGRHHDGPPPGYGREDRRPEWRHERDWHRHYVPPPVIYYPPPQTYYAPPPVAMPMPGLTIVVPLRLR